MVRGKTAEGPNAPEGVNLTEAAAASEKTEEIEFGRNKDGLAGTNRVNSEEWATERDFVASVERSSG
jgi:hypothetical protein